MIFKYITVHIKPFLSNMLPDNQPTCSISDYLPPFGFIKLWTVFMLTITAVIFGEKFDTTVLGFLIALKMTLKFFMMRQSMDEVKFHEMHLVATKEEAIQKTIYVILIGLYFGGDFLTNAYIQRWYTLETLDPMFTIVASEVMVDFFFIWKIPYCKIWREKPEQNTEQGIEEEDYVQLIDVYVE
jgi:hypothetical protein